MKYPTTITQAYEAAAKLSQLATDYADMHVLNERLRLLEEMEAYVPPGMYERYNGARFQVEGLIRDGKNGISVEAEELNGVFEGKKTTLPLTGSLGFLFPFQGKSLVKMRYQPIADDTAFID